MKDNIGIGVMISMLGGNRETVEALHGAIGKTITKLWLDHGSDSEALHFRFADGTGIRIFDAGQSCCERRYMVCDDKLEEFVGSHLISAALKQAPNLPDSCGNHEVQFLDFTTDRGVFQVVTHNEHNGYYGGFAVKVAVEMDPQ